jgi:hypothetical protein
MELSDTGDPRVNAAVARLRELADQEVHDHLSVYEDVHQQLQAALADSDGQ